MHGNFPGYLATEPRGEVQLRCALTMSRRLNYAGLRRGRDENLDHEDVALELHVAAEVS